MGVFDADELSVCDVSCEGMDITDKSCFLLETTTSLNEWTNTTINLITIQTNWMSIVECT